VLGRGAPQVSPHKRGDAVSEPRGGKTNENGTLSPPAGDCKRTTLAGGNLKGGERGIEGRTIDQHTIYKRRKEYEGGKIAKERGGWEKGSPIGMSIRRDLSVSNTNFR